MMRVHRTTTPMRILRTTGQIAAGAVLVIVLVVLIGAHVYGLPFIAPIGSTVLSLFGPWLVVVSAAIGALEYLLWRAAHPRGPLVLMIMAVAATAWASMALARMVAEVHDHGVPISLVRAFRMGVQPASRPDDDLVYGTWQDQPLRLVAYKPRSATPGGSAPILLYVHGGGFTRVTDSRAAPTFAGLPIADGLYCRSTTPCHPSIDICGIPRPVRSVARWPGPRPMRPGSVAIPPAFLCWALRLGAISPSMPRISPTQADSNLPAGERCRGCRQ